MIIEPMVVEMNRRRSFRFETHSPHEKEIRFFESYSGLNGKVAWKEATTKKFGILNLNAIYYPNIGVGAYAYAVIESPDGELIDVQLKIGK